MPLNEKCKRFDIGKERRHHRVANTKHKSEPYGGSLASQKVSAMKPMIKAKLTAKIRETWARISNEQSLKLVSTMPDRCHLVINNKGRPWCNTERGRNNDEAQGACQSWRHSETYIWTTLGKVSWQTCSRALRESGFQYTDYIPHRGLRLMYITPMPALKEQRLTICKRTSQSFFSFQTPPPPQHRINVKDASRK